MSHRESLDARHAATRTTDRLDQWLTMMEMLPRLELPGVEQARGRGIRLCGVPRQARPVYERELPFVLRTKKRYIAPRWATNPDLVYQGSWKAQLADLRLTAVPVQLSPSNIDTVIPIQWLPHGALMTSPTGCLQWFTPDEHYAARWY